MGDIAQGYSSAHHDMQAEQLNDITIQKGQADLDSQRKMSALLSGSTSNPSGNNQGGPAPAGPPKSTADILDQLGTAAAGAGLFDKANSFLKGASTIRKNEAYIATKQQQQELKRLDMLTGLVDNVNDQGSWQRALGMYQMLDPQGAQSKEFQMISSMPYNPEMVAQLKQGFASVKDQALTAQAQAGAKARDAETRERTARTDVLIPAQAAAARARAVALQKAGAGGKLPPAADVATVSAFITRDFGTEKSDPDVKLRAQSIAERAQDLLTKTPGITRQQALGQAYIEAKTDGSLGGLTPAHRLPGATPSSPMPLPTDKSKMLRNKYYVSPPNSKYPNIVWLWDGAQLNQVDMPAEGEDDPDAPPPDDEPDYFQEAE